MSTKPDPAAEPDTGQQNADEVSGGRKRMSDSLLPNAIFSLPLIIGGLSYLYSEVRSALTEDRPAEERPDAIRHEITGRILRYRGNAAPHGAPTDDETSIATSRLNDLVRDRLRNPALRNANEVLEAEQEEPAPEPDGHR